MISGLLERRLPGPGTRIVSQQLEFDGRICVGEELTARVTVREKPAEPVSWCSTPRLRWPSAASCGAR